MAINDQCPCGSCKAISACCLIHVNGHLPAPSAEALMRSRYTAYVLGRMDYLLETWHPDTRPAELTAGSGLRWLGLAVKRVVDGGPDDSTGRVEFVARSKIGGRASRLHETSYFEKIDGRWLYCRGDLHHA